MKQLSQFVQMHGLFVNITCFHHKKHCKYVSHFSKHLILFIQVFFIFYQSLHISLDRGLIVLERLHRYLIFTNIFLEFIKTQRFFL